jgi:hypothetical protein
LIAFIESALRSASRLVAKLAEEKYVLWLMNHMAHFKDAQGGGNFPGTGFGHFTPDVFLQTISTLIQSNLVQFNDGRFVEFIVGRLIPFALATADLSDHPAFIERLVGLARRDE